MKIFGSSLTLQMAIATLLGILAGLFFGEQMSILAPAANAYIMILKVTAIPYLMVAIIHGVGQMSDAQGKIILKKGIIFVLIAWVINICVIYLMAFLFPKPQGEFQGGFLTNQTVGVNYAQLLIPDNIFYALSNNIIPAVVIFSLFIGLALMTIQNKQNVMSLLEIGVDSLTRITMWISRITPIGTFLIIANQAGTVHFATIKQIATYIILYILGTSLVIFWIFPRLLSSLTPVNANKWIKDMAPILILAYTTNTVIVCLPYIIQLIQKETQHLYPEDQKATLPTQGVVSVIFNLPLASLFIGFFVLFISIFYQMPLGFGAQLQLFGTAFLTGLGAVGIGSWINSLTFLLTTLGLPAESVKIYLTTIPFTAGFQSMVSSMEIAVISFLITLICRGLIKADWPRILRKSALTLVPIVLIVIGFKTWNFLPQIKNPAKKLDEIEISCPVKVKIYEKSNLPAPRKAAGDVLADIIRSKKLRVGYYPFIPPFSFFNNERKVIGYDIAFACQLADDLGCDLELVPLNYGKIAEELNSGLYDIGMSAISITESRIREFDFTDAYMQGKLVLVTAINERQRNDFEIAALKNSSFAYFARELFPNHSLIELNDYSDFPELKQPVALLWEEQEAISWVLSHPGYTIVYPEKQLGIDSFGYAIKAGSGRFLHYLNQWLTLKENEGFSKTQYDLWILRKTDCMENKEPRWSIINYITRE